MADLNISHDGISIDVGAEGHLEASADKVLKISLRDKLVVAWGAVISQRAGARLEEFQAIEAKYVLLFVNKGRLHVKIDGETFTACKGQTLLIWPWENCIGVEPHKTDLLCQWLSFEVRHARGRGSRDSIHLPRITDVSDPSMVSELFRLLAEDYHKHQPKEASVLPLSNLETQLLLLSLLSRLKPAQSHGLQASNSPAVLAERARDYMRANQSKVFSITELARLLDCSTGYLRAAFRSTYGYSPITCLLSIRMYRARQLLTYSRLTINEIARECGYTDPSYFGRAFTREHGMPPTQYRIAHSRQYVTPGI